MSGASGWDCAWEYRQPRDTPLLSVLARPSEEASAGRVVVAVKKELVLGLY